MNTTIEVRIYNPDLELQGIIDEFSSLIWIRRYQGVGEFELHTPYSEESRQLLVAGNLVQKFDGKPSMEAGVIEFLQMNHEEIVVKGRFWEIYLEFRTVIGIYDSSDFETIETIMRNLTRSHVASQVPQLELGPDHGFTESFDFQVTNKSLTNLFSRLCRATGLGFRIYPDFTAKKLYFEVYKGIDRSADSASKVIFSETYDNLMNETYTYNNTNYRNVAKVTQLFEDGRYIVYYDPEYATGLNYRVVGLTSSVDPTNKTYLQINDEMKLVGKTALENYKISETFTFATDPEGTFKYREDYDLGDLVIINHIAWGIYQVRRITEVEEDYEGGKVTIIPTCGDPLPESVNFEEGY